MSKLVHVVIMRTLSGVPAVPTAHEIVEGEPLLVAVTHLGREVRIEVDVAGNFCVSELSYGPAAKPQILQTFNGRLWEDA